MLPQITCVKFIYEIYTFVIDCALGSCKASSRSDDAWLFSILLNLEEDRLRMQL